MKFIKTIPILTLFIALSGCSLVGSLPITNSGSLSNLLHTASGYVIEAGKQAAATIELGKMGIEKAKETAGDLQDRADQLQKGVTTVQQGIESVKQGKEILEKAVTK